jgi:ankyrin repeat protein
LRGATLLHVAAEYGLFEASHLLLDRGADVNARADTDANGVGGQTPIFHALTHFKGVNPDVAQLLIARGADLTIPDRVPGHYERSGELLDVSAAEYGAIFPLRFATGLQMLDKDVRGTLADAAQVPSSPAIRSPDPSTSLVATK